MGMFPLKRRPMFKIFQMEGQSLETEVISDSSVRDNVWSRTEVCGYTPIIEYPIPLEQLLLNLKRREPTGSRRL